MVALERRVLRGGHEALDAVGGGVGLGEVDELQRARGHRPHADVEADPGPLLDVVAAAREVDPGHAADAPLGVCDAARVAVHDGVVRDLRGEGIVRLAVGGMRALALLGLVGAAALLGARLACRRGAHLDGVARDLPAARSLGQALELVGRLVDRLEMALVLELLARRGDVRVPDLRLPATRELHVALVERRLQLEEEQRLLDVENGGHGTVESSGGGRGREWLRRDRQRAGHVRDAPCSDRRRCPSSGARCSCRRGSAISPVPNSGLGS